MRSGLQLSDKVIARPAHLSVQSLTANETSLTSLGAMHQTLRGLLWREAEVKRIILWPRRKLQWEWNWGVSLLYHTWKNTWKVRFELKQSDWWTLTKVSAFNSDLKDGGGTAGGSPTRKRNKAVQGQNVKINPVFPTYVHGKSCWYN